MTSVFQNGIILNATFETILVTGSANGTNIYAINVANEDTIADQIKLIYNNGTTSYILTTVTLPALIGTDGSTEPMNLLDKVPDVMNGNGSSRAPFINVGFGHELRVQLVNNPTAQNVCITAFGVDL